YPSYALNLAQLGALCISNLCATKPFLSDTGEIEQIIFLDKEDQKFKSSIEKAIWRASPFVLPSNPEVRKQVRKFNIKFTAK
ncbi:hypothetical protein ACEJ55_17740, partial [Acinetobacter baumannii]